jgi:Phage integrase family
VTQTGTQDQLRTETRAQRLAMPLARAVVRQVAAEHGARLRPVQLRRTDIRTGQVEQILVPRGHTLASVCAPCAERAKTLRAAQCREGWHLDQEPGIDLDDPNDWQRWLIEQRAETQAERDRTEDQGDDTAEQDALNAELDEEITHAGLRGNVLPARPVRRHRSTRRRQDAPNLPRRKVAAQTVGKTYTAPDGKTFRPSMFVTLTCPSYGRVRSDGTPADPDSYDYGRADRDALHFAALFDRFIQNLRRSLGYDVQYFAAVEPQRRLAPHIHIAMRGTVSRAELRQVLVATYHQVWWPDTSAVRYDDDELPVWHEVSGNYLDSATGEVLPSWEAIIPVLREHASIFVKAEPGALAFPGVMGGPLRRGNFNKMSAWPYAVKSIGAEGLHFHDLRHTGNTFAASSGAGLRDLMARMGHDSERAAMIYQHEARGADQAITDAIDTHVQAEQRGDDDDDDGQAGVLAPVG